MTAELKNHYKAIPLLSMIYISILFSSAFISHKIIKTPIGDLAAGSLTGPFWFILSDVIAEVYGFKFSKKLFWAAMICELFFIIVITEIIKLPSPQTWKGAEAYQFVASNLLYLYLCQLIAVLIAWYVNTCALLKWKILFKGKYFWLRCIGASGIGAIIFSFISPPLILWKQETLIGLFHIGVWSASLKLIFTALFSYPAGLLVAFLKDYEDLDVYDFNSINPLKTAEPNIKGD